MPITYLDESPAKITYLDSPTATVTYLDEPVEILGDEARQLPDLQATTRGGGRAPVASAGETIGSLMQEFQAMDPNEGVRIEGLSEKVKSLGEKVVGGYGIPGVGTPTPPEQFSPSQKLASGAIQGADELVEGIVQYFTSTPGIIEATASKTPIAPVVFLKWAKDMVEGGMIQSDEALAAYRRGDMEAFGKHAIGGLGMMLGAFGATKHGVTKTQKAIADFEQKIPRGQGIGGPPEPSEFVAGARRGMEAIEKYDELQTLAPRTAAVVESEKPTTPDVTQALTVNAPELTKDIQPKETVVAAAVKIGDTVGVGTDHAAAAADAAKKLGIPQSEVWDLTTKEGGEGGLFQTSTGRIISLDEAASLSGKPGEASHASQIVPQPKTNPEKISIELVVEPEPKTPTVQPSPGLRLVELQRRADAGEKLNEAELAEYNTIKAESESAANPMRAQLEELRKKEAEESTDSNISLDVPRPDLSATENPITEADFKNWNSETHSTIHAGTDLTTGEPLYWVVKKVSSLKSAQPAPPAPIKTEVGEGGGRKAMLDYSRSDSAKPYFSAWDEASKQAEQELPKPIATGFYSRDKNAYSREVRQAELLARSGKVTKETIDSGRWDLDIGKDLLSRRSFAKDVAEKLGIKFSKSEQTKSIVEKIKQFSTEQQPPPTPPTQGAVGAEGGATPTKGIISGTQLEMWANDRIAEGKKRLSAGLDPELMTAYAIKGAAILERGVRDFAKWSAEMVKEYGDEIKPSLRRIYAQSSQVFESPARYAVEGGKLRIVSEAEAKRMEKLVKLNKDASNVKEQLALFDREIGEALTEGGKFLPKEMRPDVAKGAPAERATATSKDINQYFVNQLVTAQKALKRLKSDMAGTADPASLQFMDLLQKRFEKAFRQVQELRRASHESLYFWNRIRGEYQDIARQAGQMPEITRSIPILDKIFKELKERKFGEAGKSFVDYLRVNLFTPFSFTLDFTTNLLAVAAHTPAWAAMDAAHLVTGKPATRTLSALRALKMSGKNVNPMAERFRLPDEIEAQLGTAASGEFQGMPKEVMVDFSEILKGHPELASKLKNLDYILGGPVRMKRAVDNFFGRFGATAELYNSAYQSGRSKGLKGDSLKEYVDQFVMNPPEQAITDAVRVGGEFKFNRELPDWAERFSSNIITKLAVEAYPRWTMQFTKWAGEMLGADPSFFRQVKDGKVSAERTSAYLAKAATGWGALYAFNQLLYNQVDPNTMEYVNEKGERIRLSGRQPFPELYMLTALFRGDIANAKAAFPYTSIPFASMTGGQGGLLSPIMQTMIESWKGNYTAEQTARELTKILNNAIPGKSMLGLLRAIYDPTIREGVGAPIPGIAGTLPQQVNPTTGEPSAPQQRIPGTGIKLPTVGGTPFPGAVRVLNPIEKVLLNHGITTARPRRTSLIEIPATDVPKELRREYEQHVGRNVKAIIGEAIASKEWAEELSGKENFDTRRQLLVAWLNLARSMAKAELSEKYNKSVGGEKTEPLSIKRLPDFVKELPPPK